MPPTGTGIAQGYVTITPASQVGIDGEIVAAAPTKVRLDATGSVSQAIASLNGLPQLVVSEQVVGSPTYTYTVTPPTARTDAVTNTSGSSTILDPAIGTADAGKAVAGVGVPVVSYVGTVTSGTSFTLVDAVGDLVPTTAAVTSVVVGAVDLTTIARSPVQPGPAATFVTQASVGQVGGPAGPLDAFGQVPAGQLRAPWEVAQRFAGLVDPTVLTPWPGNDPNLSITLAGNSSYSNWHFICSELHLPSSDTYLYNCRIECFNTDRGVRFDEDGGTATARILEHCQITAVGTATNGAGFTLRLCEVVDNGDDAARLGRSYAAETVFELCYFHDFKPPAGAHTDGIQVVTFPAADIRAYGCWIEMNTAAGYTKPADAGYTGAVFYDATDVPISPTDPQPHRVGRMWVDSCRLVSTNNFSVVVDTDGVDISNSMLLPGTTAIFSNPNDSIVTGHNNVDANYQPIPNLDIVGALPEPVTLGVLQDVDVLTTAPIGGQGLGYSSVSKLWVPTTFGGGGGAVQQVAAANGTIEVTGTIANPLVGVGSGIPQSSVTSLVTDLAAKVPDPVTTKGDLIVGTGLATVDRLGVGADGAVLTASSGAATGLAWTTSFTPIINSQRITDGNLALNVNTAGAWVIVKRVDGTTPVQLAVAAAVGDWVEVDMSGIRVGSAQVDEAVIVAGSAVRYLSTNTATPSTDGDVGWYGASGFILRGGARGFTVASGDISGGTVTIALVFKSVGTGAITASTGDVFYWVVKNLGPHR